MGAIEQDAEYVEVIRNRLDGVLNQTEFALDTPDDVIGTVRRAGLVLVTEADFEAMVNAYVMDTIR